MLTTFMSITSGSRTPVSDHESPPSRLQNNSPRTRCCEHVIRLLGVYRERLGIVASGSRRRFRAGATSHRHPLSEPALLPHPSLGRPKGSGCRRRAPSKRYPRFAGWSQPESSTPVQSPSQSVPMSFHHRWYGRARGPAPYPMRPSVPTGCHVDAIRVVSAHDQLVGVGIERLEILPSLPSIGRLHDVPDLKRRVDRVVVHRAHV